MGIGEDNVVNSQRWEGKITKEYARICHSHLIRNNVEK